MQQVLLGLILAVLGLLVGGHGIPADAAFSEECERDRQAAQARGNYSFSLVDCDQCRKWAREGGSVPERICKPYVSSSSGNEDHTRPSYGSSSSGSRFRSSSDDNAGSRGAGRPERFLTDPSCLSISTSSGGSSYVYVDITNQCGVEVKVENVCTNAGAAPVCSTCSDSVTVYPGQRTRKDCSAR